MSIKIFKILNVKDNVKDNIKDHIFSKMGMFDLFVCNKERLDSFFSMTGEDMCAVELFEIGSKGKSPTGACYGLNKTFVAGRMPLKASTYGKKVSIVNTGKYDESKYATDKTIIGTTSETAYEQPSPGQIERVQNWLVSHGYSIGDEYTEETEETDEVEDQTEHTEKIEEKSLENINLIVEINNEEKSLEKIKSKIEIFKL